MKRNWMLALAVTLGSSAAMFGQQYPQQDPRYQSDPAYNQQQPNQGQYDPNYDTDPSYAQDEQGVYAPAPPPAPSYAYDRPPMPGPDYFWVDGYWNWMGGRYSWVGGYWMLPPYAGGYWISPRYVGGRYFRGYWGGHRPVYNRGFVRSYRTPAPMYRAPAYRAPSYRAPAYRAPHVQVAPPANGFRSGGDRRGFSGSSHGRNR